MIHIDIEGSRCIFRGKMPPKVEKKLIDLCKYKKAGVEYSTAVQLQEWDGYDRLFRNRKLPVGLLDRVELQLELMGVDYEIYDYRVTQEPLPFELTSPLRPYQEQIVEEAIKEGHLLLQAPTGSGKTVMMLSIISRLGLPSLIVVPSKDLVSQTLNKIKQFAGQDGVQLSPVTLQKYGFWPSGGVASVTIPARETGPGNGVISPLETDHGFTTYPIYVSTWQLLDRWIRGGSKLKGDKKKAHLSKRKELRKFLGHIDVMCLDEVHYYGAAATHTVAMNFPAKYRYGFSATMFRSDRAEMKFHSAVGEIGQGITPSELIQIGRDTNFEMGLVPPDITFITIPPLSYNIHGDHNDIYNEYIVDNNDRNKILSNKAVKDSNDGLITLVLCSIIDHGKILENCIPDSVFINGSTATKKRKRLSEEFGNGEIPVAIGSNIFNVGVDFPIIQSLIFAGPFKSAMMTDQRLGRGLRVCPEIGKRWCRVTDTMDSAPYLRDWSMARYDIYSQHPEYNIRKEMAHV